MSEYDQLDAELSDVADHNINALTAEVERLEVELDAARLESTRRLEEGTGLAARLKATEADLEQAKADLARAEDTRRAMFADLGEALGCDIGTNILGLIRDLKAGKERQDEELTFLKSLQTSLTASRKARAELAQRLDDTETALADEKQLSARQAADIAALKAQIETLKSQFAKHVSTTAQRTEAGLTTGGNTCPASIRLSPLAIQIRDLYAKGNNARRICTIINNRLEPAFWMNEPGVAAVLDLIHGEAA